MVWDPTCVHLGGRAATKQRGDPGRRIQQKGLPHSAGHMHMRRVGMSYTVCAPFADTEGSCQGVPRPAGELLSTTAAEDHQRIGHRQYQQQQAAAQHPHAVYDGTDAE